MDSLTHCKTNVQICENVDDTPYSVWQAQDHHLEGGRLQQLTARLRASGALCAIVESELWVFGSVDEEAKAALHGLSVHAEHVDEGELDTEVGEAADGRQAREILLDAIQASVSFRLAHSFGVLRVGPWTWLCANGGEEHGEGAILLQLHIKTSESGSLYAMTTVEETGLTAISPASAREPIAVRLAPSGVSATTLPDGQGVAAAMSGDAWKAMVTAHLAVEGIEVDTDDVVWLPVCRGSGDDVITNFVWPAQLCLVSRTMAGQHDAAADRDSHWKSLFAPPEHRHGFKHPLTFAEEWFSGKDEREKALITTSAPMIDSGLGLDSTAMTTNGGDVEGVIATSPFIQRVADQQNAMAGIYPTPEDNLIPPNPSQQLHPQQQQADNASSSVPPDNNGVGADAMHAGDTQDAPRNTSSSDGPAFQPMHDDLFDDMVNDMDFGSGEVGDADFDFFNEDVEATPGKAIEDVPVVDDVPATEEAANRPQQVFNAPNEVDQSSAHSEVEPLVKLEGIVAGQPVSLECGTSVDSHSAAAVPQEAPSNQLSPAPDKPLSPFGIKERLLPPPIPASARSAAKNSTSRGTRPPSAFDPVIFREGLDLTSRYVHTLENEAQADRRPSASYDISLPPKRKKLKPKVRIDDPMSDVSESEEDSFTSVTSVSEEEPIDNLPWNPHKRKRIDANDPTLNDLSWPQEEAEAPPQDATDGEIAHMLEPLLRGRTVAAASTENGVSIAQEPHSNTMLSNAASEFKSEVPVAQDIAELSKLDLIYLAQLVSEQAISCLPGIDQDLDIRMARADDGLSAISTAFQRLTGQLLSTVVPNITVCDISNLALVRDSQSARTPSAQPARPGVPRHPPQRSEAAANGPDLVSIAPPYVRVQRGHDTYEMLPPALEFWETLSFAPCNGPKNIRAFCVFPDNEDVQRLMDTFIHELSGAYESCKLGSHVHIRNVIDDNELDDFEDGLAPVKLDEGIRVTLEAALKAYQTTCVELGTFLANIGHLEAERDRTIVIYILDVFPRQPRILHHLSACFWLLYKAYRENLPKSARNAPKCDIVLQILPVGLVASADTLICLDSKQFGALAKEVYDRCPPAPMSGLDLNSSLPNYAAPFVELAAPPPKRIGFQLSAEPPSDLLHEASSLHVAHVPSKDGTWLTVSWVDNTGRYASTSSFCLRGRTVADVFEEVWDRTRDIMAARDVSWRVIIVTTGAVGESIKACWRKTVENPRKQPYSVTLLTADLNPKLTLSISLPSAASEDQTATAGSFLTPVSTPSAQNMTTVSPDASAHNSNAPTTPAPSDPFATVTAVLDSDPDAHLVDLTDESLGVLFNQSYTAATASSHDTLASGALYKRGDAGTGSLDGMRLDLLWTVQVRPNGTVDEGGARQAEMTLREVMRAYRALSVLTRAKGLQGRGVTGWQGWGTAPLHLVSAIVGARALEGFLG